MESFSSFEFHQSLPLCCGLAVVGGILEVAATAVTAVPFVRRVQGRDMQACRYYMALAGNVSLQLTGSVLSHLMATWFGPVSVVVPFFYASTLLSNMVVFGWLLGLEFFSKSMRVGTFVIVVAVVLLPVVGPTIQQDQDITALLLHHLYAKIWFAMLLVAMTLSGVVVGFLDLTKYPMPFRVLLLLIARASSISLNLTVSKGFLCQPTHRLFVALLVLKIVSGAIYTYAIVVQSTAVHQATFAPLNTTTIIVTNALTGILVWQDDKVIQSWYGYACVFVLLGLGCDLLLSEAPVALLTEDNPKFGVGKKASTIVLSVRRSSSIGEPQQGGGGGGFLGSNQSILSHQRSGGSTGFRPVAESEGESAGDLDLRDSYKDAWRSMALSEMDAETSAAFSFASALQTAAQGSYQQGVTALHKATSAVVQNATHNLQSAAANTYQHGVAAVEKAWTMTSAETLPISNTASSSSTSYDATTTTSIISTNKPKRKKGVVAKTLSVLKHPGKLFASPQSSKSNKNNKTGVS